MALMMREFAAHRQSTFAIACRKLTSSGLNAPARRLYESLGFEVAATRPNYYVSPPEDALILWKGGLNCVTFRS